MKSSIRSLQAPDLAEADHIFRLAFGTFIGLPEPTQFGGDASYIAARWRTNAIGAFAAETEGKLIGSNLATSWGSFGFFGPLSVHPDWWNQGIAKQLVAAVVEQFEHWGTQQVGLFTFPNSPKHHALYQKFGFYPQYLTAVMAKAVAPIALPSSASRYSQLSEADQSQALSASRALANTIFAGLDLSTEIVAVQAQSLGDTVLLWDDDELAGFALCHYGAGTEAGSDTCYVKFGAVRSRPQAGTQFAQLLSLCEALAASQGMTRLLAGVNTSRQEAYCRMIALGFRTEITGVAMQKPNEPGYNRPDVFALDDWR
ncbi:MAG: GNAT family N-acetyltransferase [Tildeniella nuda ZEHNDER 1965/U140]|jgi:GNAT superfamily N-acetyltransferase|nr:GNAT family N-acetyltransferase [Tildeniella nuda ZEHNDER 1965/U140]